MSDTAYIIIDEEHQFAQEDKPNMYLSKGDAEAALERRKKFERDGGFGDDGLCLMEVYIITSSKKESTT